MTNIIENIDSLRVVLEYTMSSELEFFEESLAEGDAKNTVGYHAWLVAKELGISSDFHNEIYKQGNLE